MEENRLFELVFQNELLCLIQTLMDIDSGKIGVFSLLHQAIGIASFVDGSRENKIGFLLSVDKFPASFCG